MLGERASGDDDGALPDGLGTYGFCERQREGGGGVLGRGAAPVVRSDRLVEVGCRRRQGRRERTHAGARVCRGRRRTRRAVGISARDAQAERSEAVLCRLDPDRDPAQGRYAHRRVRQGVDDLGRGARDDRAAREGHGRQHRPAAQAHPRVQAQRGGPALPPARGQPRWRGGATECGGRDQDLPPAVARWYDQTRHGLGRGQGERGLSQCQGRARRDRRGREGLDHAVELVPRPLHRAGAAVRAGGVVLPTLQGAQVRLQEDGHLVGAAHPRAPLQALQRGCVELLDGEARDGSQVPA
mmetsp:Transcript_6564/g.11532  ORF Transcript_6564/g.11532 Transcript_6564/m.11532 type:complete len:298 (-) Transcript_6564:388-1281(-)